MKNFGVGLIMKKAVKCVPHGTNLGQTALNVGEVLNVFTKNVLTLYTKRIKTLTLLMVGGLLGQIGQVKGCQEKT